MSGFQSSRGALMNVIFAFLQGFARRINPTRVFINKKEAYEFKNCINSGVNCSIQKVILDENDQIMRFLVKIA